MDTTTQFLILGILIGVGVIAMITITINNKSNKQRERVSECELTEEEIRAQSHIPSGQLLSDIHDAERLLKHYEHLMKDPNILIQFTAKDGFEATKKVLKIYTQIYEYRKKHK